MKDDNIKHMILITSFSVICCFIFLVTPPGLELYEVVLVRWHEKKQPAGLFSVKANERLVRCQTPIGIDVLRNSKSHKLLSWYWWRGSNPHEVALAGF